MRTMRQCVLYVAVVSTMALASGCRLNGKRESTLSASAQKIGYTVWTLSSGKQVKVIGFHRVTWKPSTMMLDYLTNLDIYDSVPLEREVEEIWAVAHKDLPSDVDRVEILPTEPPERRKDSPIQALSKAYIYDRCGEGWCKGSGFRRRE